MGASYSYSKIGTFESCPLAYDLQYVRKIKLLKDFDYDVIKGIIFHHYAEVYKGNSREAADKAFHEPEEVKPEFLQMITPVQHKAIQEAFASFNHFYDTFLKSRENFTMKEFRISSKTPKGHTFTGFLDLVVLQPKEYWIIDYKTPKGSKASFYSGQLYTYIHYIMEKYKIPVEEVRAGVFFPFATDVKSDDDRFKEIKVTGKKIEEQITKLDDTIALLESPDRSKEANMQWLCNYCQYKGVQELCPLSVIAGARPVKHYDEITKTLT